MLYCDKEGIYMFKIKKTILAVSIASAFASIGSQAAIVTTPQHKEITASIKADDKNIGQNIVYTLSVYDLNGALVTTGTYTSNNVSDKQGKTKAIKFNPGINTPPGQYMAQVSMTDGRSVIKSPLKEFTVTKTDQWIYFMKNNCQATTHMSPSGVSTANNYIISNYDFYQLTLEQLNTYTSLPNSEGQSADGVLCSSSNGTLEMPTDNNFSNKYIDLTINGSAFKNIDGLGSLTLAHNLSITNTSISNIDSISNLTQISSLDLNGNNNLNNVTGIGNLSKGKVSFDPDKNYTVKMPETSSFCTNYKNGTITKTGTKQYYYNVCETPSDKLNDLQNVRWFNGNCGTNFFYADKSLIESQTSIITCTPTVNANFPPILINLATSLNFTNATITDYSGFSSVQNILGTLIMTNTKNSDMTGFSSLISATGGINLSNNTALTSLNGLSNLVSLGTNSLNITGATNLNDVSALSNLTSGKINAIAKKNYSIKSAYDSNFCSYLTANTSSIISNNSVMDFCNVTPGTEDIASTTSFFNTYCNKSYKLPDISLFENDNVITNCTYTGDLNLPPLPTKTSSSLNFNTSNLTGLGMLSNIVTVNGDLDLRANNDLTSLSGLGSLQTVTGALRLGYIYPINVHSKLVSLNGLESLTKANIAIKALGNDGLVDLRSVKGIENLSHGSVDIENASALKIEMTEKASLTSPLCTNIKSRNVLLINGAAYFNLCEYDPVTETEKHGLFAFFQKNCNVFDPTWDSSIIKAYTGSILCTNNDADDTLSGEITSLPASSLQLLGTKKTGAFKKVETAYGSIKMNGRTGVSDFTELSSLKSASGTIDLRDMPNLTSLNGLENYTGSITLYTTNDPLLNDVSALKNVVSGTVYMDNINYATKMLPTDSFCQAAISSAVTISQTNKNWYGNMCALTPEQQDAYTVVKWFRDNCNETYTLPNVSLIENDTSSTCNFSSTAQMNIPNMITKANNLTLNNIESAFITSGLNNMATIGNLTISDPVSVTHGGLTNLNFLTSLTSATSITAHDLSLTDISGLSNLTTVNGYIYLYNNPNISSILPLQNLSTVSGGLYLSKLNLDTKASETSSLCGAIMSRKVTLPADRVTYMTQSELCLPTPGYEGLFELSNKLAALNKTNPTYVNDYVSTGGWVSSVINLNQASSAIFGSNFFEISNENGLSSFTTLGTMVNFDKTGITSVPNALKYITNAYGVGIYNETSISSISNLSSLTTLGAGGLNYVSNGVLTNFNLPSLLTSGNMIINSNTLTDVNMTSLNTSGYIRVTGTSISSVNLNGLTSSPELSVDAPVNSITIGSNAKINTLYLSNTMLLDVNFLNNLSNTYTPTVIISNPIALQNIDGLYNKNFATLNLSGIGNIDLSPLSSIKAASITITDQNYTNKIAFDSYVCKIIMNSWSTNKSNYCYDRPIYTGVSNITGSVTASAGYISVNGATNFSVDIMLDKDVSTRSNLTFSIANNPTNDYNLTLENHGTYLTLRGVSTGSESKPISVEIIANEAPVGTYGYPTQNYVLNKIDIKSSVLTTSCYDIINNGLSTGDGVYTLDIDGDGPTAPFSAYCDMTTDGGGWTLALYVTNNGSIPTTTNTASYNACILSNNPSCSVTSFVNTNIKGSSYMKKVSNTNQNIIANYGYRKNLIELSVAGNKADNGFLYSYYSSNPSVHFSGYSTPYSGASSDANDGPYGFTVGNGNTKSAGTSPNSTFTYTGSGFNNGVWGNAGTVWVR
jgi:hypothetical protein